MLCSPEPDRALGHDNPTQQGDEQFFPVFAKAPASATYLSAVVLFKPLTFLLLLTGQGDHRHDGAVAAALL